MTTPMTPRLLIIDDDTELCELLAEYLATEGFDVVTVNDGVSGLARAMGEGWDLIVLDVMLPGMNGFDLLKQLKSARKIPVLMLTARGEDTDTVVGLELGADDYVAKPINPRVLVARLRALLRRGTVQESTVAAVLRVGDLELDPAQRKVTVRGKAIDLTGAEFNLLALLVRSAGQIVSKDVLAEEGLGRALQAFDRRIETHMSQIRRKLGPLPDGTSRIQTVRGSGYQYVMH
jgi:DNA-binding response OmpR family regulator